MINRSLRIKKILFLLIDLMFVVLTALFSFLLRFEGKIPLDQWQNFRNFIFLVLILNPIIFYWQKLYHFNWKFIGLRDLYKIIKAVTLSNVLIAAILFILRDTPLFSGFPRSIVIINYFLLLLAISGLRISKRVFIETMNWLEKSGRKVLIVGAGEAGEELSRSILKTRVYNLIGFIDDDENKQKIFIHGYPVLGKRVDIPEIVKKFKIEEIIIAIPSAEAKIIRETMEICQRTEIKKIKILPSLQEIIDGKITLANVREITIEDLLGREPVKIDTQAIQNFISGKRVLITGAAGSIGSNLCWQILKFKPAQLIALDQNETGLFYLENDLEKEFPQIEKKYEIGDICDENKIDWLFKTTRPEIVFHAAAYKHVPMMETHPREAVKNNIFGTLTVAQAAIKYNVDKFVFISTDKAVNPTSVMGATKQIGEKICLWLNKQNKTKFCAVRFGNVLDSRGNVVELFEKQIKKGGPVEVTHPEMKRYFMVTTEACLLVMQAGALSQGGEIFVLDMGKPIKILDLAKEMIRLAGYQPDIDIPIIFTKPRPGEKISEELITPKEKLTKCEKIFIAKLTDFDETKITAGLKHLKAAIDNNNNEYIIKILKEIASNYKPLS